MASAHFILLATRVTVSQIFSPKIADSAYFSADPDGLGRIPSALSFLLGPSPTSMQYAETILAAVEAGDVERSTNPLLALNLAACRRLPDVYALLTALLSPGGYARGGAQDPTPSD